MQHRKVVSWLAMHNFPHGMVAFMEGIMKDPLRQKLNYLKGLQTDVCITIKYCIRIKYTTSMVYIQYTYIVGKYEIYLYKL
jgi:hypothetical protein